jgi:hypothetical protein
VWIDKENKKNGMEKLNLTSRFTKFALIYGLIIILAMAFVLYFILKGQDFHPGMIIGSIIWFGLLILVLRLLVTNADVRIEGNKIIVKKLFSPEKSYAVSEIHSISSRVFSRAKYTTVEFNRNGEFEKFLLINKLKVFSSRNLDSEKELMELVNRQ